MALIATARQAATEMTDRLRLLSSEQEILTAEVATKAQLLDKVMAPGNAVAHPLGALLNPTPSLQAVFCSCGKQPAPG